MIDQSKLRPMSEAPTRRSTWIALWYQAKPEWPCNIYPVAAHYADTDCDGLAPPAKGWFMWSCVATGGFYEAPANPIGWTPIEGEPLP